MRINIYLSGNQFIEHEVSEEQAQKLIKSYDSPSCSRIVIKGSTEVYHIAKSHIVAIMFKKDTIPTAKLLN